MTIMRKRGTAVSVADAKRGFSDLLGRVAYGGETILITRRGKPMARLVPVEDGSDRPVVSHRGWLEEDDPFFAIIDEIVSDRVSHTPRVLASRRREKTRRSSRQLG
jgi:prevent-host-death family protein